MPTTRESFLSQFNSGILPHVFEFGKRIANTRADVFMLMARKAACFVDCLEELKLTELNGAITTDRVLDMDTSWLRGKRVALVDDALISGTTLYRTEKALREAGVSSTSLNVFCVNKEWWSRDLTTPDQPYVELNDQQTTSFCSDIVEALSVYPRPYAVDFPLFVNARVPIEETDSLSTMSNWETFNLSSTLQRSHRVISLTAIPSSQLLDTFNRSIGWNLSEHCQLVKVRIYARLLDVKRKSFWCRTMPIVALDPLEPDQINELWRSATSFSFIDNSFTQAFTTLTSKLRLIQYLASFRIGRLWLDQLKSELTSEVSLQHDLRTLGFLFPPRLISRIDRLCNANSRLFGQVKPSNKMITVPANLTTGGTKFKKSDLWSIQARLTEPFLDFYWSKELKARRLAKKLGKASFGNKEYKEIMDRLRTGISLPQMRSLLSGVQESLDVTKLVSLYIDLANDRGITVPVTTIRKGAVFRAYRHGEDVNFTEVEERLACLMLREFANATGRASLPHIWTEKMLVLLIRIGVHKQFLTRWAGTLGEEGSVGIRYALKGAVVQAGSTKMYEYNSEGALTSLFLDSGSLKKEQGTNLYIVDNPPEAPTKERADGEAIIIGHIFGKLLNLNKDRNEPKLNNGELILLATCLYPNDVAGALAAEIDIFARGWRRRSLRFGQLRSSQVNKELEELHTHPLFEAITSGAWKFRSFMNNVPWQIVEQVAERLENPVFIANWRSFWPSTGSQSRRAMPSSLKSLLKREGMFCIKGHMLVLMLELALHFLAENGHSESSADSKRFADPVALLQSLESLRNELEKFDTSGKATRIQNHVSAIRQKIDDGTLDPTALKQYCVSELDKMVVESRAILDLVDTLVTPFGQPRRLTKYAHALYIELGELGHVPYKYVKTAERVVETNRILAKRNKSSRDQIARLECVPQGQGDFHTGRWVCATGAMGRNWLIRLAGELIEKLSDVDMRLTLIANLFEDEQLLRAENTFHFRGQGFWNLSHHIINEELPAWKGGCQCFYVAPTNKSIDQAVENDMGQNNLATIPSENVRRISFSGSSYTYGIRQFGKSARPNRTPATKSRKADIGIITVITPEMRAVKEYLKSKAGYKKNKGRRSQVLFYEGNIPNDDGDFHRVVCTQQLEQGNRSTVSAYDLLMREYAPYLVVLLGIAGSIRKDVEIGDVVIAEQILYYDKRKETEAGTVHRGEGYKIPAWLKLPLNSFFVDRNEPAELNKGGVLPYSTFKVRRGSLGSGEAVLTNEKGEARNWLSSVDDRTLAVETEAGGLVQAFYEQTLSFEEKAEGYLIVRGISDRADKNKDDQWQQIAAENAMVTLAEFLSTLPRLGDFFRA